MRRLALYAVVVVASFAFWHSGARAAAVCEREAFVGSGTLSAWPPGARCTFGEPETSDTFLNPWFFGTLLLVLVLACVLGEALARVRTPAKR
jgi:hypothetical protein